MIRMAGSSAAHRNHLMQKSFGKFKAGVSAAAVLVALFGVLGFRKLQALARRAP